MKTQQKSLAARLVIMAAAIAGLAGLTACESYDNGTSRSTSTRTVETPTEKTTTKETVEKKVEDYPR